MDEEVDINDVGVTEVFATWWQVELEKVDEGDQDHQMRQHVKDPSMGHGVEGE